MQIQSICYLQLYCWFHSTMLWVSCKAAANMPILGYGFKIGHCRHTHKSIGSLLTRHTIRLRNPRWQYNVEEALCQPSMSCWFWGCELLRPLKESISKRRSWIHKPRGVQAPCPYVDGSFPALSAQQKCGWLLCCQLLKLISISQNFTYLRKTQEADI